MQAEEAGVAGNLAAGAVLTLLSPLPGTGSTGAVTESGITGGADIESIAELLDRLLYVRRNPPVGGALHDYVIWAREVPGVSRAWAWDAWHGPGTVGLAWLYDDREDIIPHTRRPEDNGAVSVLPQTPCHRRDGGQTGRHRGLAGTGQAEEGRPVHPSDTGQPGEQERRPGQT